MKSREQTGVSWNPKTLGYEKSSAHQTDEFMRLRIEKMRQRALEFRPLMLSARIFAPNNGSREKAAQVAALYDEVLGKPTLEEQAKSFALVFLATIEWFRIQVGRVLGRGEIVRQPPSRRVQYKAECFAHSPAEAAEIPTSLDHRCKTSTY